MSIYNSNVKTPHQHGQGAGNGTPTYRCWISMMQRCYRPKELSYKYCGAKGIIVCERWHDFRNFFADMGEKPKGLTLDRYPDTRGNYEPSNCRWATMREQVRNRTISRTITYNGETRPLLDWAESLGLKYSTLRKRLNSGWSIERSLSTPTLTLEECGKITGVLSKERSEERKFCSRGHPYDRLWKNKDGTVSKGCSICHNESGRRAKAMYRLRKKLAKQNAICGVITLP